MSNTVVLIADKMYLQKQAQWHPGEYIGEDSDGNLYKDIFAMMIVGLKQSIPFVVKACPETKISGESVAREIWEDLLVNTYFSHLFFAIFSLK